MDFPMSFIRAGKEYNTPEKFVPAPYFRAVFEVSGTVSEASIIICGVGYYQLSVNGSDITKGHLAPYRSNPDDILYYDEYEVASKLSEGKNVIGVLLGNGMINAPGAYIWDFEKARYRGAPQVAFRLDIIYENGEKQSVVSDENTLTANSPILFDDLHFGEYYDARLELPGWNTPDFDDSGWKKAEPAPALRGVARMCEAEPILVRNELKPIRITELDGAYIYDFGIETAGLCRLKIDGKPGQCVLMQHFETFVDGKPYYHNIRFNDNDRFQEDEYYCKGGKETYKAHFTYHGFRYVRVSGITAEQATNDLLIALEMNSDIKTIGSFSCSDEIINRIQKATVQSDLTNFYYFPTDCPQREKNGWTADASLSSEQMLLNLTPEKSYREWMHNIYCTLSPEGSLPGIIPTGGWGYQWGNGPAWDNVIVYLPYMTYRYRGDRRIIEEAAIPLMRYLNYLYSRLDVNSLLAIGLGDWCQPDRPVDQYETPVIVTDSILAVDIARKCSFIYEQLGLTEHKAFADALASRITFAIREKLIDHTTGIMQGDTQSGQAMGIFYGMFTEEEKARAFKRLLELIDKADGHMNTGVLGGKVIFRVLAENGQVDLAYNMITRPDFPSYGNWLARGATTLWESFHREGDIIHSLNHHFWGDISAWFYLYLAGIRINPDGGDTAHIDIRPAFASKLNFVKAEHRTPNGRVAVDWKRTSGGIEMQVEAAKEMHGMIACPNGFTFADGSSEQPLKSGSYRMIQK